MLPPLNDAHGPRKRGKDRDLVFGLLENLSDSRDLDVTDCSLNNDELFTESSIPQDNDTDLVSMMLPEDGVSKSWELGSEESDINSSIYKLEILSIQLVFVYGNQACYKHLNYYLLFFLFQ